jgi:hypothetical protein
MIDSSSGGGKPWLLDKVYVIKSGLVFRAHPPTKVVNNGQTVTWDARGRKLRLTPQSEFSKIDQVADDVVTAVIMTSEPYFEYEMTCDDDPVQGNSPPVIIIE